MPFLKSSHLKIEMVRIEEMWPVAWNPRRISEFQMEALKSSLVEFGAVEPIVLNTQHQIIGGHQRWEAAKALGWESFPSVIVDLDDEKQLLLNLALNQISGTWDQDGLAELIAQVVQDEGGRSALMSSGFEGYEIDEMLAGLGDVPTPNDEPVLGGNTAHECPACHHKWRGSCTPDA